MLIFSVLLFSLLVKYYLDLPANEFQFTVGLCNDREHDIMIFFTIVLIVKKIDMAEFAAGFVV